MKKTHIGSTLDDLLKEDRLLEVATARATKRVIAHQIAMEMKRCRLTKMAMASRMKTSRAALDRLLDPDNPSVTIGTLERAAAALNRWLTVELRSRVTGEVTTPFSPAANINVVRQKVLPPPVSGCHSVPEWLSSPSRTVPNAGFARQYPDSAKR